MWVEQAMTEARRMGGTAAPHAQQPAAAQYPAVLYARVLQHPAA